VTARTTAFGYRGRTGDIRQIGRALRVGHIVEGSVRRGGDSVRVVVTLLEVRTGDRLMDESFDEAFVSVLQLQTRVAARVAERLQRRLRPGEDARLASRHSGVPGAYDAYMNGRYLFDQRIPDSLLKAAKYFQRAIELDSTYGRAHAGLADTYSVLAWLGVGDARQWLEQARVAAQGAVRLNPAVGESHVSLGLVHTFRDWNWTAADSEFSRAIEIDSSLAMAHYFRAWALVAAGNLQGALNAMEQAVETLPDQLGSPVFYMNRTMRRMLLCRLCCTSCLTARFSALMPASAGSPSAASSPRHPRSCGADTVATTPEASSATCLPLSARRISRILDARFCASAVPTSVSSRSADVAPASAMAARSP